jgi:hypothetical protein
MWLLDLTDAQLRSDLGLILEDIAVLRAGTPQNPPNWKNTLIEAPSSDRPDGSAARPSDCEPRLRRIPIRSVRVIS